MNAFAPLRRTLVFVSFAGFLMASALVGCDRTDTPNGSPQHGYSSSPAYSQDASEDAAYGSEYETERDDEVTGDVPDGAFAHFLGVRAPIPASWRQEQPQSTMHQAMYTVPGVDGADDAQIVVFYFGPGQGGSVEANIERWKNQFQNPDGGQVNAEVRSFEASDLSITIMEVRGGYLAMGARAHAPDQYMIGSIVDTPAPASQRIFIRFVGPTDTVEANRDAFIIMMEEMRWIGQ